jgi:hypothetical protein
MKPEQPTPSQPSLVQPSSTGTLIVGVVAVAALIVAALVWFIRESPPVTTTDTSLAGRLDALAEKIVRLEQRLDAAERERVAREDPERKTAAAPAPASAPVSTPSTAATPVQPAAPAPASTVAGPAGFELIPNAELKGRLGRIVLEFPAAVKLQARTDIFESGTDKRIRTEYGSTAIEMPPGSYDLLVGGSKVPGVRVEPRTDTRVHVGVLRLNATGNTRFDLFATGSNERLLTFYGQTDVGLPAGQFDVMVNEQRERVVVEPGRVTEY